MALGDMIRSMGFKPSRVDPDLWMKETDSGEHYEYIATYVDDIIIVAKDPQTYMNQLIKKIFSSERREVTQLLPWKQFTD